MFSKQNDIYSGIKQSEPGLNLLHATDVWWKLLCFANRTAIF